MTGADALAAATSSIDEMRSRADAHHAQLEELRSSQQLSQAYKAERIQQHREEFDDYLREARATVESALSTAKQKATHHLAQPADDATEIRKGRAAMRVSRLIDAGMSAGAAAEIFASQRDVDALRALRDEVPSLIAATVSPERMTDTPRMIDAGLLAVDRMLGPLLEGPDAEAVNVRLAVDDAAVRLRAVTEYALNPTASARLRLAYSEPVHTLGKLGSA